MRTNKTSRKKITELNNTSKLLNRRRIDIKNELLELYNVADFETKIKEIDKLIVDAANDLDKQVKDQETAEKKAKENEVRFYFDELKLANPSIDFIKFEDVGLNITLSITEPKLKQEVKVYVDKVLLDLEEINTDPNASRLLSKYKLSKNLQQSRIALNRELQIENAPTNVTDPDFKKSDVVDAPQTPHAVPVVEELITLDLKVTTTKSKLLLLKQFLEKEGIQYE